MTHSLNELISDVGVCKAAPGYDGYAKEMSLEIIVGSSLY